MWSQKVPVVEYAGRVRLAKLLGCNWTFGKLLVNVGELIISLVEIGYTSTSDVGSTFAASSDEHLFIMYIPTAIRCYQATHTVI